MSLEIILPAVGSACVALGAGLAKWGPDFFKWLSELVKGRTAVTLRVLDETAKGREETQRTFEELGSSRERVRWLKRELEREREMRQRVERELAHERAARKQLAATVTQLEDMVRRLERTVLEMIGPAPKKAAETKGHRR